MDKSHSAPRHGKLRPTARPFAYSTGGADLLRGVDGRPVPFGAPFSALPALFAGLAFAASSALLPPAARRPVGAPAAADFRGVADVAEPASAGTPAAAAGSAMSVRPAASAAGTGASGSAEVSVRSTTESSPPCTLGR